MHRLLSFYHFLLSFLGAVIFGFPSRQIFVLGVTGTKGKSTVLELINVILEAAGKKTALLSSIRIKIDRQSQKNYLDNTMPGRAFIQRFLRHAVKAGCDYALVEVTSQGILQHRHRFINWDAALFTNLAPEHIEAHGGFEKYREVKAKFFTYVKNLAFAKQISNPKLFFINKGDPSAQYFIDAVKNGKIILYSKDTLNSKFYILNPKLKGDFNQENIAAAVAFAKSQGINDEIIKKAIENFPGVPGRMEIIPAFVKGSRDRQEKQFTVVIDYAHTPDSLEKIYQTLTKPTPNTYNLKPKLICVLGSAGGGRDKWKRPKMGEIAAQYCDEIILTNEDPYDEDPMEIIEQVAKDAENISVNPRLNQRQSASIYKILDRKEAIRKAVSLAKKDDVVVITGKGCEPWMHSERGKKIPWDERKTVEEIISETSL